ncbi:MAG: cytochrome P450 [Dehalococcoidia bacterium]
MLRAEPIVFNPGDPSFRADPYPAYVRLRDEDPVHETPIAFVVSRYQDCVAVLRDQRWSSDQRNSDAYRFAVERGLFDPEQEALSKTPPFLVLDPPDHTRLRALVSKAFTPKVVEALRPHIQQVVDALLDRAAERGSLEVIEDLAYPLPVTVVCELLGVPPSDRETFKEWSGELARGLDPGTALVPEVVERRRHAGNAFMDYFRALIGERRKSPRDDLISALIAAEEAGDRLTEAELLSTCILLLAAGHETTANLIGNGVLALLRHPEQLGKLRDDPSLAAGAVEEVLRYDSPVQMVTRTALEEVELVDVTVRKGQQAALLIASANRDPAQFAEPDRFDITRQGSRHLGFGFGLHACLGAALARVEGEIAFRTLARRFDWLELLADPPEYKESFVNRGPRELRVGFAPATT